MQVHAAACLTGGGGWIVARTKPRQEAYAAENVARQGYDNYLPYCIDQQTRKVAVLFPGYLFVRAVIQWTWLKSTYGIIDIVYGSGGTPANLSNAAVEEIRQRQGNDGMVSLAERFRRGQTVRLMGGPFFGFTGLYEGLSGGGQIRFLLNH
jgi:transcription antitermination factor NusG